jgi:LacI family transcriptional regulator, gluconate utilization system Gnt-I transcriptional repressor
LVALSNVLGVPLKDSKNDPDRPVRVEDVAREAGVSPITVSRALRTPDLVRPETRQRVAEAVAKTGYVVNSIASTLRSGRSSIVTVFVASLQNPNFANATQGALDAFEGSRFHLMFAQTGYSDMANIEAIESALPFRPAGVMFTGVVRDEAMRDQLKRLGVPVVEMWGDGENPIDMLVSSSTMEGGRVMGRHFAERGFKRIAYCGHTVARGGERLAGFREELGKAGAEVAFVLNREGTSSVADGMEAFDQIMAALPDCDAIFFGTDVLAVGAILAARRRGIRIPQDISVAGYGDLDFAAHIEPPLTTVHVSDYQIGRIAGDLMRMRLENEPFDTPVIHVPLRLEARESTSRK